jgi:sugar (pentulose or hexulose) kinase
VVRTDVEESAALGAAILAGIGTDIYPMNTEESTDRFLEVKETVEPTPSDSEIYERLHERYQGLYKALEPEFERIVK